MRCISPIAALARLPQAWRASALNLNPASIEACQLIAFIAILCFAREVCSGPNCGVPAVRRRGAQPARRSGDDDAINIVVIENAGSVDPDREAVVSRIAVGVGDLDGEVELLVGRRLSLSQAEPADIEGIVVVAGN